MAQGVDVGDAEAVGHHARRGAATTAGERGARNDARHSQEVGGEALCLDDGKLVLEALHNAFGELAVAALRSLDGGAAKRLGRRKPTHRWRRKDEALKAAIVCAGGGYPFRVFERVGKPREEARRLVRPEEERPARGELLVLQGGDGSATGYGAKHPMQPPILIGEEARLSAGCERYAEPSGLPLHAPGCGRDHGVKLLDAALQAAEELRGVANHRQPVGALRKRRGETEGRIALARARNPRKPREAPPVACEEERPAVAAYKFHAYDGANPMPPAGLGEIVHAVEIVDVGECEGAVAQGGRRLGQLVRMSHAVEKGEARARMQMDEHGPPQAKRFMAEAVRTAPRP